MIHRAELIHESDAPIVCRYQSVYRGIANYYRLAYNRYRLDTLKRVMEISLLKTRAPKHQMSALRVRKTYRAELVGDGKKYLGLQVILPRENKKSLRATWGAI